jgi:predicted DNA-binding protein (MmcQ/YjbR family)
MIEFVRDFCLSKEFVTESFPFDENTLVFKVHNKIFLMASLESEPLRINLKCNPEKAIELREEFWQVIPGFHSNKKHWNTITLENLEPKLIAQWINHSYQLIWQKLPKTLTNTD